MKPLTLLFPVFLTGASVFFNTSQMCAQDTAMRELDRVSDLLEQLQGAGWLNSDRMSEAAAKPRATDPFSIHSQEANAESLHTQANRMHLTENVSTDSAKVEIDDNSIRINLDGQELVVPRLHRNLPTGDTSQAGSADSINQAWAAIDRNGPNRAMLYQQLSYALMEFSKGEYQKAKSRLDAHDDEIANDGMVAQIYAMLLFQTGHFADSAKWAHRSLRVSKPFNWDTIQGFYSNPADYSIRYQQLQKRSDQEPERVELRFLLAYHHLMLGHNQHAARELKVVKKTLVDDATVQRLSHLALQPSIQPPKPLPR